MLSGKTAFARSFIELMKIAQHLNIHSFVKPNRKCWTYNMLIVMYLWAFLSHYTEGLYLHSLSEIRSVNIQTFSSMNSIHGISI